ncbi:MAG: hypothetical protein HOQ21_11225 [Dermatophilaceae bacterium]|nr:hypothetical protein [Dermatophilaceae bacterium]
MKVRIKVRPSGLINLREWPEVGETIDLPDDVAEGMIASGDVEAVKDEKKPAAKTAAKKAETRPASSKSTETRKS